MKIEKSKAFVVYAVGQKFRPNLFETTIFDSQQEAEKYADFLNKEAITDSEMSDEIYQNDGDTFSACVAEFDEFVAQYAHYV